jgi:RNA polymerase sigma-70 factor (ECF subfamily)
MATAKRRAIDVLRREGTARKFAPELERLLESEWTLASTVDAAFDAGGIEDVQLRMMFSCVHPELPEESQLGLVLHLVCGFGMDETAAAFLKKHAAMEKRLTRAKQTLARSRELFDLSGRSDVAARLPAVLHAVYLLFNEGYHGASAKSPVRVELCEEALRLVSLLLHNPLTATPATHALAALVNFHAARLAGRTDANGDLVPFAEQNRSRWDRARIAEGRRQLLLSATGDELTAYHLEAAIAELHADAVSAEATDWRGIVKLYDTLMRLRPSPVVALNRAVAVAQLEGPERGLHEIERIEDRERLRDYPFYFTAIGEFEWRLGHLDQAREAFAAALGRARSAPEQRFLEARLRALATSRQPIDETRSGEASA